MKRIFLFAAIAAVIATSAFADTWPWPCCPNGVDPTGLRVPPVYVRVGWYRFADGSEAIVQQLFCRDTEAILWWSYNVYNCSAPDGLCEALRFPTEVPWMFPPPPPSCTRMRCGRSGAREEVNRAQ